MALGRPVFREPDQLKALFRVEFIYDAHLLEVGPSQAFQRRVGSHFTFDVQPVVQKGRLHGQLQGVLLAFFFRQQRARGVVRQPNFNVVVQVAQPPRHLGRQHVHAVGLQPFSAQAQAVELVGQEFLKAEQRNGLGGALGVVDQHAGHGGLHHVFCVWSAKCEVDVGLEHVPVQKQRHLDVFHATPLPVDFADEGGDVGPEGVQGLDVDLSRVGVAVPSEHAAWLKREFLGQKGPQYEFAIAFHNLQAARQGQPFPVFQHQGQGAFCPTAHFHAVVPVCDQRGFRHRVNVQVQRQRDALGGAFQLHRRGGICRRGIDEGHQIFPARLIL